MRDDQWEGDVQGEPAPGVWGEEVPYGSDLHEHDK